MNGQEARFDSVLFFFSFSLSKDPRLIVPCGFMPERMGCFSGEAVVHQDAPLLSLIIILCCAYVTIEVVQCFLDREFFSCGCWIMFQCLLRLKVLSNSPEGIMGCFHGHFFFFLSNYVQQITVYTVIFTVNLFFIFFILLFL